MPIWSMVQAIPRSRRIAISMASIVLASCSVPTPTAMIPLGPFLARDAEHVLPGPWHPPPRKLHVPKEPPRDGTWLAHPLTDGGPWLVAHRHDGEIGYVLVVDEEGTVQQVLLRDHVVELLLDGDRLIVFAGKQGPAGWGHYEDGEWRETIDNEGRLYRFERATPTAFAAPRIWALPAYPTEIRATPAGSLTFGLRDQPTVTARWQDDELVLERATGPR